MITRPQRYSPQTEGECISYSQVRGKEKMASARAIGAHAKWWVIRFQTELGPFRVDCVCPKPSTTSCFKKKKKKSLPENSLRGSKFFLDIKYVLKIKYVFFFFKELSVNESKSDKFNFPSIKQNFLKVQGKGTWDQMCFGF